MADSIFEGSGGGGVTIGAAISGGTANEILFGDGSANVAQSTDLFYDDALKIFHVGDFGLAANKTYIALNDQNSKIDLQTTGTFKAGDIGSTGNDTLITLDDTTRLVTVGNTASGSVYSIWDIANHNFNTYVYTGHYIDMLHNNGVSEYIILRAGNNVGSIFIDNIDNQVKFVNGANNKGFLVDYTNKLYKLGDIDAASNSTLLTVDDNAKVVTVKQGGNTYLNIDKANNLYQIGDISGSNNGTRLSLADSTGNVSLKLPGTFTIINNSAKQIFYADFSTFECAFGDIQNVGNQTLWQINDSAGVGAMNCNGNSWIYANGLSQYISIGDSNTSSTLLTVNVDSATTTIQSALTQIGDPLSTGNNTLLTVDDSNSKITVTKPFGLQGYTVATLPTGFTGAMAYVTDALAPAFGATVVGGGAVVMKVRYDGSNWIVG